jgi:excisionase family DNA binding protein
MTTSPTAPVSDPPPAAPELTPWLTVKQAAARAQCGVKTIYNAVARRRLKAARLGARRELRIHRTWLDAWIESIATIVNPEAPGATIPFPHR